MKDKTEVEKDAKITVKEDSHMNIEAKKSSQNDKNAKNMSYLSDNKVQNVASLKVNLDKDISERYPLSLIHI